MKFRPILFSVCVLALVCMSGCGIQKPQTDPSLDAAAQRSAEAVHSLNRDIQTSKGTGHLRLETEAGVQTFQMAWAAKSPDRVRLTFTALASPVETIVADGKQVIFISHTGRHKPHTTASGDPDLEPYTGVPLTLSDMVCLLLGQIPVQQYGDAWFASEDSARIQLHRRFTSRFQELILAPDQPVKVLRQKNRHDEIRYEIRYHAFDTIDNRQIPVDLTIVDGKGRQARMTITRFRPDLPVNASIFQLTPIGS
jgi:outer membrane lipoprotein-sorting protein